MMHDEQLNNEFQLNMLTITAGNNRMTIYKTETWK